MVGVRVGSRARGEEVNGAEGSAGQGGVVFFLEGVVRLFCSPRSGEYGRSGEQFSWARQRDEPPLQMKSDGGGLARSQNS